MIADESAAEFRPWPQLMPGGGIAVEWDGKFSENLRADWDRWPAEFRLPMLREVNQPHGVPKVWAGPKDGLLKFSTTGGTTGGVTWAGLYMSAVDVVLMAVEPWDLTGNVFAHEWGHLVDYTYNQRVHGLGRSQLSYDPEWRQLYSDIKAANPTSTRYSLKNATECWAECFSAWMQNRRDMIDFYAHGRAFGDRVVRIFARLVPFDGMEILFDQPAARMSRFASEPAPEHPGCGGVV